MIVIIADLFARSRLTLLWWVIGMLAMAVYVVAVYDSLGSMQQMRDLFDQYPESIRELFGDVDIGTLDGWIHVELLSWLPLVLGIYGGIFAGGNVSREVEQRTVDFVLGLPISRTEFILSRLVVGLLNIAIICVALFLLLVAEVALIGHEPPAGRLALALFNGYLLGAALFCAYVLIATFTDEQTRVIGITLGATLVLYIASGALTAAGAPEAVRWLTPFEHYHAAQAMSGDGLPMPPLIVLALGAMAASAAAIYWYNRRDIAA